MQKSNHSEIHGFLYTRGRYYGQVTPENLVFNANLQEFSSRVSYISNLETAGKISPQESYKKIEDLWKQLKSSYCTLGIDSEA